MITIAVIGLGNIAERHRSNLKKIYPNALIIAMSASSRMINSLPENADKIATSIDEIICDNPYFCIVASPASSHAEMAIPLLESKIPCLIEKPIATNSDDAELIYKTAQQTNTPVIIGYCLRYLPAATKVHKLIQSKELGEIYNIVSEVGQYLPNWRPGKDYRQSVSARKELGGGVLLELSHEFDYLQFLFQNPTFVHATLRQANHLETDVEDIADIVLVYQNNIYCNIHLDFIQHSPQRCCTILAEKGRVEWNLISNTVTLNKKNGIEIIYQDKKYQTNNMYLDMINSFIYLIDKNKNNNQSIKDSCDTIALIELIKKQAIRR